MIELIFGALLFIAAVVIAAMVDDPNGWD